MIIWKTHKAAFSGSSKYLIKGVFQVVHSAPSIAPVVGKIVTNRIFIGIGIGI